LNHFLSLAVYALIVSACFALLMKPSPSEQRRYFVRLLFYFAGLGLIAAWVMYFLPFGG
jgi:hypothetical protein